MRVISQAGGEAFASPRLRVRCPCCPRACALEARSHGACQIRVREGDAVVISGRGLATGFLAEPVEAFDLAHFLPGTLALAVGRGGTNLHTSSGGRAARRQAADLLRRMGDAGGCGRGGVSLPHRRSRRVPPSHGLHQHGLPPGAGAAAPRGGRGRGCSDPCGFSDLSHPGGHL